MRKIVFDLETSPLEDAADYLEPSEAPSNYTKPEAIARYVEKAAAEQLAKCSLDPDLCRVVAIGYWIESQDGVECDPVVQSLGQRGVTEAIMIRNVLSLLEDIDGAHLVGFNCLGFDLPVLLRRSLYLGLRVPSIQIDRFKHPQVTDLLSLLSFDGKLKLRGLAFYCRRFGIDVPDPVTGADIGRLVLEQDWPAVEAHCKADVRRTGLLAARMGLFQAVPEPEVVL